MSPWPRRARAAERNKNPSWLRSWRQRQRRCRGDDGTATIEFIGVTLMLIVPLLGIILTVGRVQAATFAAQSAAREAGRAMLTAESSTNGQARALAAVGLALSDQGFDDVDPRSALQVRCTKNPCLTAGGEVATHVAVPVTLPFIPHFMSGAVPSVVTVTADHVEQVDDYRATS